MEFGNFKANIWINYIMQNNFTQIKYNYSETKTLNLKKVLLILVRMFKKHKYVVTEMINSF